MQGFAVAGDLLVVPSVMSIGQTILTFQMFAGLAVMS
jgi:hypothetical protein